MTKPANFYKTIGGASGCRALATEFYSQVARDPILRPLFPSTFRCAIEEFSAFLVQFLGGEVEATQGRWWLSLRESHARFSIGQRERSAWLNAMGETLKNESLMVNADARRELLAFFSLSSSHVVNQGELVTSPSVPGELVCLWDEQRALDEAVRLLRAPDRAAECLDLLENPTLRARFARSPPVHASVLALAANAKNLLLQKYAHDTLRTNPMLVYARYSHSRTLLHDAAGTGNLLLVNLLLDLGAGREANDADGSRSPLYCVTNECNVPEAGQIVRVLLERTSLAINAVEGAKRCTALHMAARRGNIAVIEALVHCGADVEVRDSVGDTPLRRAVNCNRVEAAQLLLGHGANPDSVGSRALTPKTAARSEEMKKMFETIRLIP